MSSIFQRSLWWIKRDIRLDDNPALLAALARSQSLLPLYVLEPSLWTADDASALQLAAVLQALQGLRQGLQARGSQLALFEGECLAVFEQLHSLFPFEAIFACEETGNGLSYARDRAIARWCRERGITWVELPQSGVIRRLKDRDERSAIASARLLESDPQPAPRQIPSPPAPLGLAQGLADRQQLNHWLARSSYWPQVQWQHLQPVSEAAGQACLADFLNRRSAFYRGGISSPNRAFEAGSRLSVHIAWGTLSLRRIFHATAARLDALEADPSPEAQNWLQGLVGFGHRLHWRDHFIQRLESEPVMEYQPLNPAFAQMRYEEAPERLALWLEGRTGFPLVDACMRCLAARGFLNFRMRAMVVNVACFALRLDWRQLQYPLAQRFLDYEPGIHFSQMQMQAGIVGINQMRVYNPTKQLLDQDPHCQFVKTWVPELRRFHPADIASGQALGDYPAPCVNAAANIADMKAQIAAIRRSPEAQLSTPGVLAKHGSRLRRPKTKQRSQARRPATDTATSPQLPLPF
jgi:deoxyribodipyrimidine photo-lyase